MGGISELDYKLKPGKVYCNPEDEYCDKTSPEIKDIVEHKARTVNHTTQNGTQLECNLDNKTVKVVGIGGAIKETKDKLGTNPKDLIGSDKVPLSRVPAVSIFHEGMAMGNGGDKYGPYNWRDNAVQADIYIDACLRHIHLWFDSREENAPDSGVHHLGHAKACLGILLDAQATGNLIDNRPKDGKSNVVLEQLNETRKKQRAEIKEKNHSNI